MKTKIKLLLWSLLTILFVWLSSTYALELYSARFSSINCLSEKNGKNLIDYGMGSSNYFACLKKTDSDDEVDKYWISIPTNFFETKQYYFLYSEKDYSVFRYKNKIKRQIWTSFSYGLWKDEDWLYVFSVYKKDSKITYRKNKLKIKDETLLRVSSKRWTNLFNKWFVYAWIQLAGKKGDQGIGASIIDNTYILDWINFYIDWNVVYVLDSYSNKMYQYDRFSYKQLQEFPRYMFYLLYNSIPDKIYDVNWNVGTDWTFYDWIKELNYDLSNERSWNEEFLKKIQQDLKNSLQILNKEDIEFYLWMKPEELWIWSNSDLPQNNTQNNKNSSVQEKKSCVEYYTYMRSMSSHSDGCLWEVNKDMSDTRLDYWWAISTDWDLSKFWVRDKTKYRRCWHWNNYKEGVKKTLWDRWPAFWKDWQTNYIATESKDIDVNALCSHIVVEKSFEKTDPFSFSWMVALWWALRGILDNVWQKVKVWDSEIPVNTLSWDIGRYYTYAQACRDKRYMHTRIDSKLSYIIGYDFFFNPSNNEKVCEYAEILKKNIEKKYWGKEIEKKYRDAMANELEEKWITWDFKNIFNDKWEIDLLKLENSAKKTHSNPFKDPEDVLGLRKIFWFFQKDFDDWVKLVYSSLSGQRCWEWIWIKEWDYIMRLFVFIIWFVLFKWRN